MKERKYLEGTGLYRLKGKRKGDTFIMVVGTCKVFLRIPWAESLKDKRMVIKSLMSRCKNKFNIAIAEISNQDEHKIAGLGFCCVSNETAHANSMVDTVLNYILNHCEAELEDSEIEILHL